MRHIVRLSVLIVCLPWACSPASAESATTDADGFRVHRVASPYQTGETTIRVLLPDHVDPDKKYRVLYVLPVVAEADRRFGDGLREVRDLGVHNSHDLICVAPEFTAPSWFCDDDQDPQKRHESHFLKVVLPFIEENYAVTTETEGRLLLGFSKSGWGAMTLLLRHPDLFHKAAGWDIGGIRIDQGLLKPDERAGLDGWLAQFFGSRENFEKYRLSNLLRERGARLGRKARLFYYATEGPRSTGSAKIHSLMVELGIPHRYVHEPPRKHRWDSGWIPEAVQFLVADD